MGVWLDLGSYTGPKRPHALVMYCASRARQRNVLKAYREYVTDSLQLIPQHMYKSARFADMIKQGRHEEIDVDATIKHVLGVIEEANRE